MLKQVLTFILNIIKELIRLSFIYICLFAMLAFVIAVMCTSVLMIAAGLIGAGMCLNIAYYDSLWKFVLLAVAGIALFIGSLCAGTFISDN